jgi:hypothetical protein
VETKVPSTFKGAKFSGPKFASGKPVRSKTDKVSKHTMLSSFPGLHSSVYIMDEAGASIKITTTDRDMMTDREYDSPTKLSSDSDAPPGKSDKTSAKLYDESDHSNIERKVTAAILTKKERDEEHHEATMISHETEPSHEGQSRVLVMLQKHILARTVRGNFKILNICTVLQIVTLQALVAGCIVLASAQDATQEEKSAAEVVSDMTGIEVLAILIATITALVVKLGTLQIYIWSRMSAYALTIVFSIVSLMIIFLMSVELHSNDTVRWCFTYLYVVICEFVCLDLVKTMMLSKLRYKITLTL